MPIDPQFPHYLPPTRRHLLGAGGALALGGMLPTLASAQAAWPAKSIRFVVPFAPGGSSEIVARSTAAELTKTLGQSVFVDNKPGAAGNIAMSEVARADDQHTLILGHIGTLAVNPYIFDKLPYDANKDFKPVSLLAKVPSLYVVHPDVPAKNLKEFIAYAKKNPAKLSYGSAGNGSAGHLGHGHVAGAAGLVLDVHGLAQRLGQLGRHRARHDLAAAARRERHHQADGTVGPGRLGQAGQGQAGRGQQQEAALQIGHGGRAEADVPPTLARRRLALHPAQPAHGLLAAVAAHDLAGLQRTADGRALGPAEDIAAQLVVQLRAAHAGRLAVGVARDGRADRRGDAAGGTARAAIHR